MKPWAWPETGGPQPVCQRDLDTPQPQNAQEVPSRSYHYVLRIEIVAEGAIIKVDFIEGFSGEPDHLALVEAPVLVLADDLLARSDALQGALGTLEKTGSGHSTDMSGRRGPELAGSSLPGKDSKGMEQYKQLRDGS